MLFLIPLALVAAGAALIVAGVRSQRETTRFAAAARRTTGVVTGPRRHSGGDTPPRVFPVVPFSLPAGRTAEAQSRYGSQPPPAREGETVTVLYDPADPTRMQLDHSAGAGRFYSALLVFMGAGLAGLGVLVAIVFSLLRDAF